jgi:hypothetical protein
MILWIEEPTLPRASMPEAKGAEKMVRALKTIMKQTARLGSFMVDTSKTMKQMSGTLESVVVDQLTSVYLQLAAVKDENSMLKDRMKIMENKMKMNNLMENLLLLLLPSFNSSSEFYKPRP